MCLHRRPTPALEQDRAIETIARWSALFLRAYTLDDDEASDYVNNTGDALDENITVISPVKAVPEVQSVWSLFLTMLMFPALFRSVKRI